MPISLAVTEPQPPDPLWPRYSARPFPSYRFVPGNNQHPRRKPEGHSHGFGEPDPTPFAPEQWRESDDYCYGVDLYNYAYWWECHEVFEALWHVAGRQSEQGNFFQGLIQLAAANLKLFMGNHQAAQNLLHSGLVRLQRVPEFYMGLDVAGFTNDLRQCIMRSYGQAPPIRLAMSVGK